MDLDPINKAKYSHAADETIFKYTNSIIHTEMFTIAITYSALLAFLRTAASSSPAPAMSECSGRFSPLTGITIFSARALRGR